MPKRKIIFFIDSLQTGGAEKSILALATHMHLFDIVIVIMYNDRGDLRDDFLKLNVKVIDLNISRNSKLWFLEGKIKFKKICREIQPDIVHAHLYKSEIIARITKLPKRTQLIGSFVNDSYAKERYNSQTLIRNLKLNFIKWSDRLTISKNNFITSITNSIKVTNCEALDYPLEKTTVIYRGRNVPSQYTNYYFDIRQEKPFDFIVVGRLLMRKGYFEMIDAIKILQNSFPNFRVFVAGTGSDEAAIKNYAQQNDINNLFFLGHREDIAELLVKNHCFIFASHYEGQGGALVEAMMAGIPIIASNIPVFQEQVIHDFSAKLFQVKNAKSLADTMEWVIHHYDEAVIMGRNARKVAEERFDIEVITRQTEQFYLQVISNSLQ